MKMFQIASEETYQDGQIIFKEGTFGDWIYIIEEGAVEISKEIEGSKVVIEVLKPGESFGEMAFLVNIPRTATACAIGETTVGIVDRQFLDEEFNKLSSNFQSILKALVFRLKKATEANL
jgi:CRP/FNR family cyclic AMP-dependent transcriptional regulator